MRALTIRIKILAHVSFLDWSWDWDYVLYTWTGADSCDTIFDFRQPLTTTDIGSAVILRW